VGRSFFISLTKGGEIMEHYDLAYDSMEIMDRLELICESLEVLSAAVVKMEELVGAACSRPQQCCETKPMFKIGVDLGGGTKDAAQNAIARGFGNV